MKCVYCLAEIEKGRITKDHVIARAWFPNSTPANTEKWKVPSCSPCNNLYSKLEDDIGLRIALCIDPDDPAARGIWDKARRSIEPSAARNALDRHKRSGRRKKLFGELREVGELPQHGVIPSFADNWGKGSRLLVTVPATPLNKLVTKWIRGIHYCEFGELISLADEIDIHHVSEEVAEQAFGPLRQFAVVHEKGPGVRVQIIRAVEGGEARSVYDFLIWGKFQVRGSVHERFGNA